ncbi:helix-turn-helix domain-containing protein [Leptolyngbya sp. FACHB-261]|uniref:Crp/Fnr family transcriptional regulator n=1 Tax=Leptolyngbya sp. FACHB-261 TaxID=2692806 RepID=UPI001684EAB7|nr:helix-turn-helix domain-containing protein [Leptolyngbya sp. FACHB-261]MBD2100577.1 Crp/Fnr family transcriptional regulator [Leptolyngbya sp. FACHB-261]
MSQTSLSTQNRLLAALPDEDYQRLAAHLEPTLLPSGRILYEIGQPIEQVYFLNKGMISLVLTAEDGSMVEAGVVGREGMAGTPVIWESSTSNHRAIVQLPGNALSLPTALLKKEFERGEVLQNLLLRYTQGLFTQASQSAVCNAKHTIERRLARWLLMTQDHAQADVFPLTQEFISHMLGVRRAGVTVAAGGLQRAGLIRYSRGKITVLNRDSLQDASCECYRVVKTEFERLFGLEGIGD